MLTCCTLLWNSGASALLGFLLLFFFISMMFYLIKDTDLLNSLSFYIWGERS